MLRPHSRAIVLTILAAILESGAGLLIALITGRAVNILTTDNGIQRLFGSDVWVVGAVAGLFVCQAIFNYAEVIASARAGEGFVRDLRVNLFSSIIRKPLIFFARHRAGDLASRLTHDVNEIQELLTEGARDIFLAIVTMTGALAGMFWFSVPLTLIALIVVPMSVGLLLAFRQRIRRYARLQLEKHAEMNAHAQEHALNILVTKAFNRQDSATGSFEAMCDGFRKFGLRLAHTLATYSVINRVITWTALIALVLFGFVLVGEDALTIGALVAFLILTARVTQPVLNLSYFSALAQRSYAAGGRIIEILDTPDESSLSKGALRPEAIEGGFSLNEVAFFYDRRPVLDGVSCTIKAGEFVALVGPSGAGKSTLMALLLGLYRPSSGRVLVDGIDYEDIDLSHLRRFMAYVPQEPMLFTGTIRENIAFSRPGASLAEIETAAEQAGILDFIRSLPDGLDTYVGERGAALSGGESQRISLARAFLADARIVLMDEPTSAMDAGNEARFKRALDDLTCGRTTIVIAHRLSTIEKADRVLVLDKGRLVQDGPHSVLASQKGLYRDFHRAQTHRTA